MENYIIEKQPARDAIQEQISKYLLDGGKIEVCKSEEVTPNYAYKAWNNIGLREVL